MACADDYAQRRWAALAISGQGEAGVMALAQQAEDLTKTYRAVPALDWVEGAAAAKARVYLAMLKQMDAWQASKRPELHPGYARFPRDLVAIRFSIPDRFIRNAVGQKQLVPEYKQWLESLTARREKAESRQISHGLEGLLLLDPGQKDYVLAQVKRMARSGDAGGVDLLKFLGRAALPLLADLEAGQAAKPSWQLESVLAHLKALADQKP